LKVIDNFSPLKLTEFIAGLLRTITGASVSFGPPDGETIFAHLENKLIISNVANTIATNFFKRLDILIVFPNSKVINLYNPLNFVQKNRVIL
jgi:hypothetical protein